MTESQDIEDRRVYVIRPNDELIAALKKFDDCSLLEDISRPQVVMTDELPFEEYFEGWRSKILELCKLSFLQENLVEYPTFPENVQDLIFGSSQFTTELFDKWWVYEEAEYTQIPTSWKSGGKT